MYHSHFLNILIWMERSIAIIPNSINCLETLTLCRK